jgi:hypothetical protein
LARSCFRAAEDFANQRRYENHLSKGTFGWQANSQLLNRVAAGRSEILEDQKAAKMTILRSYSRGDEDALHERPF